MFCLAAIRAWSMAHGLATLLLSGALGSEQGADEIDKLIADVFSA